MRKKQLLKELRIVSDWLKGKATADPLYASRIIDSAITTIAKTNNNEFRQVNKNTKTL